ncbi:MAG TPA: DUF364 domain-containing protein [Desulforhopalus sp.]|nr:DUF364 domain-containing protein [Desulforhopalus sp.]
MSIAENLIRCTTPLCRDQALADVRIGLGYTCVELADGAAGVAWTPERSHEGNCTHLAWAGTIEDFSEQEVLGWLDSSDHYLRAIGLAACNAVNLRQEQDLRKDEALSLLNIQQSDHVVMVGFFGPLIAQIKKTGCTFDILDLNPAKPGIVDLRSGPELLAACDVAIITATSIINGTIDGLLANLSRNRAALLLGPSTPLSAAAFSGSRISQLSGALVRAPDPLKRVISQGGGTSLMKKHLQFVSVQLADRWNKGEDT